MFVPGSDLYDTLFDEERLQAEIAKMDEILQNNSDYVMIGECGMDLYWLRQNEVAAEIFETSKNLQAMAFKLQAELAVKYKLPLTIHARESVDECLEILQASKGEVEAIFHSFTGDYDELKKIIDAGFAIGINGIVTYKSAETLREALKRYIGEKKITEPRDLYDLGIYLETDAPWLAPVFAKATPSGPTGAKDLSPLPGTSRLRNEPAAVKTVMSSLLALSSH
jgi:TatD DNase family protein